MPTAVTSFSPSFPGAILSGARASDGGFYMLMEGVFPYTARQLLKLDVDGDLIPQFAPTWPWPYTQGPVEATDDGGCISAVTYEDHLRMVRMDVTGAVTISREYEFPGLEAPNTIVRTGPGTWVIAGHDQYNVLIDSVYHLVQDHWAMAVNTDCDSLWKRTYSDTRFKWITGSIALANGDALIISRHSTLAGQWLNAVRIDPQGTLIWNHDIGMAAGYQGVCESPNGDLLFTGGVPFTPNTLHGVLYATDAAGGSLWQKTFGDGGASVWPSGVRADEDGQGIVVVGRYYDIQSMTHERLFAAGFDNSGTSLWEHYAALNDTVSQGLFLLPDGPDHFGLFGIARPQVNGAVHWVSYMKGLNAAGQFD